MSRVKKIGILALGQGVNTLVNILFLPYMSRVLDYEDYGSYGQAILIIAFASAILSAGLSQIIYIYLSREEAKTTILSSNIFGGLTLGLIGVTLMWLGSDYFAKWLNNPKLTLLISIYCFSLLFSIPNGSFNSYLIYTNKVKMSISLVVLTNLLKIALVITAIQIYKSVELALLGIVISQLFLFIANLIIQFNNLEFRINKTIALEQIKKGFPLGLTGIVGAAILYTDGIMVSKLIGVKAYAIYRNGAFEVPFIATIYSSVAAIVLPEVSKLFSEKKFKEISKLKKKAIMNTMMITYPVLFFLIFNSQEIITAYLGVKYLQSSFIFLIFNLTLLIRVNDYHDILVSANKSSVILQYYLVIFLINILLNYAFIYLFGSIGAAISTVISLFIFAYIFTKQSLKAIEANILDIIDVNKLIKLVVFCFIFVLSLDFLLSYISNINIRLFLFSFLFFPTTYYILIKYNLMSKEMIRAILPNKIKHFI